MGKPSKIKVSHTLTHCGRWDLNTSPSPEIPMERSIPEHWLGVCKQSVNITEFVS